MKICFFSGDISRTGGTERVLLIIANELDQRGYDVSVLSFCNGKTAGFECSQSIKLYSLNMEKYTGFWARKLQPYIGLYSFLKQQKIDILINVDVILCLYSLPVKRFLKTKMIAWEHFNFRSNNGVKNRDRARVLASKLADSIVVLTKADLAEYTEKLKIKKRIECIYNPSTGEIISNDYSMREKMILAVGRLAPQKNFSDLIDIWYLVSKVNKEFEDWTLIICGDGPEREELAEKIRNYGLRNIELVGFCRNMDEYYEKAKVMVLTSRYEGFPMTLLEAQKHGLPIVSYDCFTGPSEIVRDQIDGYLIPYGDKNLFALKLRELMKNDKLSNEYSNQALIDSHRFELSEVMKKWMMLLEELMKGTA